jgi:uncharacterized protein (DUF885 family)
MTRSILMASAALFVALAGCATAPAEKTSTAVSPPQAPLAVVPKPTAPQQLATLFAKSDEGDLKLSPINALARGDLRYADQFGDYITDAYQDATRDKARAELAELLAIDRTALAPNEQISFDVFRYTTEFALKQADTGLDKIFQQLPIDHFNGLHAFFPDMSSGQSIAPYKTITDYENGLKRFDGFMTYLSRAQAEMRIGMTNSHVQPAIVTKNVIDQLDIILKAGVDDTPYLMPVKNFPADFSVADKARFTAAYTSVLKDKLLPAYAKLKAFMEKEYLPASRTARPGLVSMADGDRLYAYLIEQHTTTQLTADEIHALGLSEVARITTEMEKVKTQVGYKGTLQQFFNYLRVDPKFKFKTKVDLLKAYWTINDRLKPEIPKLFTLVPKSPLEIRQVPDFLEKSQAGAYYQQGTPDGSRPGVFYVNTYDLPSRTSPGTETLFLHEAIPGHHFQVSLAQENTSQPPFMRFGGNTAYVEGWALYAESLGTELGLFKDPYQMQGHLDDEMLRAMRLVVDTGLHAKGWSREQAIQYMLDNSAMGKTDAIAEVERYIAIPGQALAYKIGQLTIRRLRTEAELALGARFDIREFHAQVLDSGALPMKVLEQKIRDWISRLK